MNNEKIKQLSQIFPEITMQTPLEKILDILASNGWEVSVQHLLEPTETGSVKRYRYCVTGPISFIDGPCNSYEEAFEEAFYRIALTINCLQKGSMLKD